MADSPQMLGRIDRAAFAAGLGQRLREAGLGPDMSRLQALTRALGVVRLDRRGDLYWAARITLVRHPRELAAFDKVFAAVFQDAVLARDPHARRSPLGIPPAGQDHRTTLPARASRELAGDGGQALPWITRPTIQADNEKPHQEKGLLLADPLPSALEGLSDVPFERLDDEQLNLFSAWLEQALLNWPSRLTRRNRRHPRGRRIDLRATLAHSRSTGFEPVRLSRSRPVRVRRPMVMLCDVSRSMQAYTQIYVHLMRAAALTARAEVFAFSTDIMRLTPALGPRGPSSAVAIERAAQQVAGRSPGTRIGHSLRRFLASRHGSVARGAIVIIASDGWDADDPSELDAAMARLHRRARHVIWLNPRAAATGFAPLTGAMSVALPYCDRMLPGNTIQAMRDVVSAIGAIR